MYAYMQPKDNRLQASLLLGAFLWLRAAAG